MKKQVTNPFLPTFEWDSTIGSEMFRASFPETESLAELNPANDVRVFVLSNYHFIILSKKHNETDILSYFIKQRIGSISRALELIYLFGFCFFS